MYSILINDQLSKVAHKWKNVSKQDSYASDGSSYFNFHNFPAYQAQVFPDMAKGWVIFYEQKYNTTCHCCIFLSINYLLKWEELEKSTQGDRGSSN